MNGWSGPTRADLAAAARVTPQAVSSYLASTGWRERDETGRSTLWSLVAEEQEFELLLPADQRLRDYPLRMFDLLHNLAVVEERTVGAVITELTGTDLDTLTFRLLPEGPPGTVPLSNGVEALAGLRELVLASTYAVTLGRPLLVQGRRPEEVRRFVQQVRLGTPQAGSWTISAQLRLPAATSSADRTAAPFPRQVSFQAHRAVSAALHAAGEALRGHPIEPFLQRADDGVSANVCEALAKLGHGGSAYEVRFGWASHHPVPAGARRFRFDSPVITVLQQAAKQLRNALPDGRVEVTGRVTKLSRATGNVGIAVITAVPRTEHGEAEQEQRVKVRLTAERYDVAVQAHRLRRRVRLVGLAARGQIETVFEMTMENG